MYVYIEHVSVTPRMSFLSLHSHFRGLFRALFERIGRR